MEQDEAILTFDCSRKKMRAARALGGVAWLMAELANRLQAPVTLAHFTELTEELISHYGDPEVAARALHDGRVIPEKILAN